MEEVLNKILERITTCQKQAEQACDDRNVALASAKTAEAAFLIEIGKELCELKEKGEK